MPERARATDDALPRTLCANSFSLRVSPAAPDLNAPEDGDGAARTLTEARMQEGACTTRARARVLRETALRMGDRFDRSETARVDEGLGRLLEVERRLEARVRDAERRARDLVESARADSRRAADAARDALATAVHAEEQADRLRHDRELERIAAESAAAIEALASLSEASVDRLAQRVLDALLAPDEEAAP